MCYRLFTYGRLYLENVKHYEYLGVCVSNSGSWDTAKEQIHNKAQKAMFALKRSLGYDGDIKPQTGLTLFDQLIKPNNIYGCELWGAMNMPKTNKNWGSETKNMKDVLKKTYSFLEISTESGFQVLQCSCLW